MLSLRTPVLRDTLLSGPLTKRISTASLAPTSPGPVYSAPSDDGHSPCPGTPLLDRPTITNLGVQLPNTGDDNFNASVVLRYRQTGTTGWRQRLPLFRVRRENTA
jgi:hypothetical protein